VIVQPNAAWPYANDVIGQTGEFLVWAALASQSGGGLHIFLPLLDRGLDAVIHRLEDGTYVAVQVKTKSAVGHGEAPIAIYEDHLFTGDQIVIGVFLAGGGLGPHALVVDGATLKRHATVIHDRGRKMLIVDMPVSPSPSHEWSGYMLPIDRLAERLGAAATIASPSLPTPVPVPSDEDHVIGFIGEQEVCRRLATLDGCCLFRPFPDYEVVEVVIRRLATGSTLGLQVKTAQLEARDDMRHVLIHRASFVASPTTYIVVLAWMVGQGQFHDTCLLIPSSDVPSIASSDGPYYELHFRAQKSRESSRIDRYRLPLEELNGAVSRLVG
jgi:hypothetical protein